MHRFSLLKADFILNTFQFNSFELRQCLWFVNSSHKLIHNSGDLTEMTLKDDLHGCAVENSFARTLLYFLQVRKQSLVNEPSDWTEMRLSSFFSRFLCLNSLHDSIHVKNERRWPLGVYMRKRTPTRVPCRGELLIYYCVYTFTSFLLITCPCDDVILVWVRCITHSSPAGGRFDTETKGRSSFTDTVCKISHRDEILRTAQQPGWTRAGMTVSGSIM